MLSSDGPVPPGGRGGEKIYTLHDHDATLSEPKSGGPSAPRRPPVSIGSYNTRPSWLQAMSMVLRLLYRLLLQRLDRDALAGSVESAAIARTADGFSLSFAHPAYATLLALGVVGLAVVALSVLPSASLKNTDGALAGLSLNIPVVGAEPLVVYLRATDLVPPQPDAGATAPYRIRSVDGRFLPEFQVVPRASTLEMVNSDTIAHNTHVFSRGETVFNVALPLQGVTVRKVLAGDGIFDVRCDMHPWMRAWVFVAPSRHYAVVDGPTTVRFAGIAPGEYVLHEWQPGRPENIRLVRLSAGETRRLRLR